MADAYKNVQGLTWIDQVVATGWPYHGRSVVNFDGSGPVGRYVEGQPTLPFTASIFYAHAANHYLVKSENLLPPWDYCFLYGVNNSDIFGTAWGENPHAVSANRASMRIVGSPLRLGATTVVNQFEVYKTVGAQELFVRNLSTRAIHFLDAPLGSLGDSKYLVYSPAGSEHRLLTVSELLSVSEASVPALKSSILDFFNNKILVSIEVTGEVGSFSGIPATASNTYRLDRPTPPEYGLPSPSRTPRSGEQGRVIIAVFELTIDDDGHPAISRIMSPQQAGGTISRSSPVSLTIDTTYETEYEFSSQVSSMLLDARYDATGNIITTLADISHTGRRWRLSPPFSSGTYKYEADFSSDIQISRGGAVATTDSYQYSVAYERTGSAGVPGTLTSNMMRNGVAVWSASKDQYLMGYSAHKEGDRAPFAGSEMVMLTLGDDFDGLIAGSQTEFVFPVSPYTVRIRNNGSGSVSALSTVRTMNARSPNLEEQTRLLDGAVISQFGVSSVAGFVDEVRNPRGSFNDPRYPFFYYAHGWLGALAMQFANPQTGQLSGGELDYPMARINFR